MSNSRLIGISLMAALFPGDARAQGGGPCPKTLPPALEMSGEPFASGTWYGSESLAVMLESDGDWQGMGAEHGYRDKLPWWSYGYDGSLEPRPDLVVTAKRLDADAPPAVVSEATNAYVGGWTMLVSVEFPSSGCWQVTGTYRGQVLSFVVEVGSTE